MQEIKQNETFQMRLAQSWKTMWNNPVDMVLWTAINVIGGLAPLLFLLIISYLIRSDVEPKIDPSKPIYEGDLFIFVTSLCASAVGVYWEIKEEHFWNSRRVFLISMFLIMFFCSAIYSLLKFEQVKTVMPFDNNSVWWCSIIVLFISVTICLHLFAMRMSMDSVEDFVKEEKERISQLTENSKEQTQTKSGENL
jgi:hypothetical membrane protein